MFGRGRRGVKWAFGGGDSDGCIANAPSGARGRGGMYVPHLLNEPSAAGERCERLHQSLAYPVLGLIQAQTLLEAYSGASETEGLF